MSYGAIAALVVLALVIVGFVLGRARARARARARNRPLHSLANFYGYFVSWLVGLPGFLLLFGWLVFQPQALDLLTAASVRAQLADVPASQLEAVGLDQDIDIAKFVEDVQAIADGGFQNAETEALIKDVVDYFSRTLDSASQAYGAQILVRFQQELNAVSSSREPSEDLPADLRALVERYVQLEPAVQSRFKLAIDDLFRLEREQLALSSQFASQAMVDTLLVDKPALALALAKEFRTRDRLSQIMMLGVVGGVSVLLLLLGLRQADPAFRARNNVERIIIALLILSSTIAVLTTIGIVASLIFESLRFFERVPLQDFLFGLQWSPQIALRAEQAGQSGAFGAVPIFAGTVVIMLVAMLVSGPIGLMTAVYLSEYAPKIVRNLAKPLIEVLAGVPTVVYGFFALLTVGPVIRAAAESMGFSVPTQSAIAAGSVMGIMIIPFISSLSDDVINAVPQSLRDGSLAVGATKSETMTKVIFPAALPGIVGAFLLAISRAIGETMIVVMAAGRAANLTANPFEAVTTVTVQIVALLTGDQEFDSAKTLSAFALGLVLFVVTLILNVIALRIVQKYRERYD
ncbi:MAG: phosphate ABC transporter permease subunit PstC [Alphaproteobacteria bacterium]|nr:phosphate ABC transporter permease subunit PstC [Alphaproteobacteria bacterium]